MLVSTASVSFRPRSSCALWACRVTKFSTTSTKLRKFIFDKDGKFYKAVDLDILSGQRAEEDIRDPKTGEAIVKKNRKFTKAVIKRIQEAGIKRLEMPIEAVVGRVSSEDIVDEKTGEVLLECNHELSEDKIEALRGHGIKEVKVIYTDNLTYGAFVRETLVLDKISSPEEALIEIYKRMRPGDPPTIEAAKQLFDNLFFNSDRYDLSKVGRLKLNYKFPENNIPVETTTLTKTISCRPCCTSASSTTAAERSMISIISVTAAFARWVS